MSGNATKFLLSNVNAILLDGYEVKIKKTNSTGSVSSNSSSEKKKVRFSSFRSSLKVHKSTKRSKSNDNTPVKNSENECGSIRSRRAYSESPNRPLNNASRTWDNAGLIQDICMPLRPIPAPLLVEDPPSSENGSDLEDLRHHPDPALLNGSTEQCSKYLVESPWDFKKKPKKSSGNFGSAGTARSAPSTPAGVLGSSPTSGLPEALSQPNSPGYISPSIQRSPSHSLFTKYDKGTLKQLSTSTPAMTAQAQSPEPPSPKTLAKDEKPSTTSKARQKKFHRHFPAVDIEEKVLNYYSCALIGDILLQGHLYITKNYFAFYSNVFGYVTKLLIPMLSVEKITKEKTARIIPNAVGITTNSEDKHVFGSLISRDNTYRFMNKVWNAAKTQIAIPETEIFIQCKEALSDMSDSSETRSDRESVASELPTPFRKCVLKQELLKTTKIDSAETPEEKPARESHIIKLLALPRHNLLLFATTFLLVVLFLSAAVLLYRISLVQHKYSLALQDNFIVSGSEDVYNELLQWQTNLHSKSAGAVHNFLDSNLDQIAKVRRSLEALSSLLITNENNMSSESSEKEGSVSSPVPIASDETPSKS